MDEKEKEEFSQLKRVRAERGFWTTQEQERWNYLFDLHAVDFKLKCQKIDLIFKQMEQN